MLLRLSPSTVTILYGEGGRRGIVEYKEVSVDRDIAARTRTLKQGREAKKTGREPKGNGPKTQKCKETRGTCPALKGTCIKALAE